jgi:hypothetical protein
MNNFSKNVYLNELYTYDTSPNQLVESDYLSTDSLLNNKLFNNTNQPISFINDVGTYTNDRSNKSIDSTGVLRYNDDNITTDIHTNLPLFFDPKYTIKVPKKVEYALRNPLKKLLREIHPNIDVAVELCLLFTTQLTSTYFGIKDNTNVEGWKALQAKYLRDLLSIDPPTYKKVRAALEYPLKNGAILECDHTSEKGRKSYHYRLGDAYVQKGIVTYTLKTVVAQKLLNKRLLKSYKLATENPICKNLIAFYPNICLPSIDQIRKEARRLIKSDYVTKKGKKLKFLNKHSKSYFANPEKYSFVEDAIEIFRYLTSNGLIIPKQGSEESGGRVVDSFTLMPSWIRRLVKIDGKAHVECDYSCLHPNIAIALYGGKQEYLTHGNIELVTGINNAIVKKEHLSFFNKSVWQMKQSPLWEYYQETEPEMIENIIREKQRSNYKYKVTSRRLFENEVKLMSDVIVILNAEGINVGYVYDALFCHPKHAYRVKDVMDEVALKHGIKTTAKLSASKNHNQKVEIAVEKKFDVALHIKPQVKSNNSAQIPISVVCKNELPQGSCLHIDAGAVNFIDWAKDDVLEKIGLGEKPVFVDAIIHFDDGSELKERVLWVDEISNPRGKYVTHNYVFSSNPYGI